MHLQSILRRVEPIKGFVYGRAEWYEGARLALVVSVSARKGSHGCCSGCGRKRPGYDHLPARRWEFVPLWNMAVFLADAPRRVNCPSCGVVVELLPWAEGKTPRTRSLERFLAGWAKLLSWQQVARSFGSSWDTVYRSVQSVVQWGLAHRDLSGIEAIGVDEVAWQKGHRYLTVVYQISGGAKRLLWVAEGRTMRSLLGFFRMLGPERSGEIKFVASDMWKAYLTVIARKARNALHVLDRFHVVAKMNKAIDEVRAAEARQLKADGHEPVLKHSRWCLLKGRASRTRKETARLKDLLKYNLRSVKAYLLKEEFQRFWEYKTLWHGARFMYEWIGKVEKTNLEPLKKVARSLDAHGELILNFIAAKGQITSGAVEGLNNKLKLHTKRAYGFRTYDAIQTALYHGLGQLPEPPCTHKFC